MTITPVIIIMNIQLESITAFNVADLIQPSESRGTEFYPVPHDADTAQKVLERAIKLREDKTGDVLAGYDLDEGGLFVGSGEIDLVREDISFGYWVVSALRGHGVGRALRTALDTHALEMFPDAKSMTAHIHYRNRSSAKIAESLGYICTDRTVFGSHMMYRKLL